MLLAFTLHLSWGDWVTHRKFVLSAVVVGLTACVSPGTDFDGLPFYRRDRIVVRKDREGKEVPARETKSPIVLARSVSNEDDSKIKLTWPFPMITYRRTNEDYQFLALGGIPAIVGALPPLRAALGLGPALRDIPFAGFATSHIDKDGEEDKDSGFFPLYVYGDSKDEGRYFAAFPFGGTTKGLLGKDEAEWYGFPLPFYLWWRDGGYESRHLMFPFINWVEGEGHTGGRLWPFYGHYERVDEQGQKAYDRTWMMWPFITWQTNGMNLRRPGPDGKDVPVPPTKIFALLPFYGHVDGPEKQEVDYLYPLFRYTTYPRDGGYELRAPFPFMVIENRDQGKAGDDNYEERRKYDFWPFFGVKWRPGYMRHFVLAPFERYVSRDDDWVEDKLFTLLPFYQYHYHLDKKTKQDYVRWQLWPFMHYRRDQDGNSDFWALSLFLQRNEDLEEVIGPFTTLYRHRDKPSIGSKETQVLLGLASWRTVRKEGREDYDRVSLLFGLFQYRKKGSEKALRFFYFADWPTWGADE
jgi:hypothetical protein